MVSGFGFQAPRYGTNPYRQEDPKALQGPDMAKLLMEGISGIADKFGSAFKGANQFAENRIAGNEIASMGSPAQRLLQAGQQYAGGGGQNTLTGGAGGFNPRSVPSMTQPGGNNGSQKTTPTTAFWTPENRQAIIEEATAAGLNPEELGTVMSYETGGTLNPWQKGPTTKWGEHRGLIQWGEPQRQQYGVTPETPFRDQVKASIKYLQDRGLKPGMGMLEMYSAINAGGISENHFNQSDTAAGGAPGTVRDKVQDQMGGHRAKIQAWFGQGGGVPAPGAPDPKAVAAPAPGPQSLVQQAQAVLANPGAYDPGTVDWARQQGAPQAPGPAQPQPIAPPVQQPMVPNPGDREAAAAVVQNNQATAQQRSQQAQASRGTTFMGLPTQAPGGNVNPGAPIMGQEGQDTLQGGDRLLQPGQQPPPMQGPQPGPAPAPQPAPRPAPAPAMPPQPAPMPYRPPQREAPQTGLDPRIARAMGAAIRGGDNGAIAGVASMARTAEQAQNPLQFIKADNGQILVANPTTGEIVPYGAGGTTKAPDTTTINGTPHVWNGSSFVPAPVQGGGQQGDQRFKILNPDDKHTRRQLGIPDSDTRAYTVDSTGQDRPQPIAPVSTREDPNFDRATTIRGETESHPVVKEFTKMEQGVVGLQGVLQEGNPSGDIYGVIQMFKTLDPDSTVTAGEQATPTNAAGVPDTIRRIWNQAMGEGGRFSPQLRADLYNASVALYQRRSKQAERIVEEKRQLGVRNGLDPDNISVWKPLPLQRLRASDFPDRDNDGNPISTETPRRTDQTTRVVPEGAPVITPPGMPSPRPPGQQQLPPGTIVTPSGVVLQRLSP